MSGNYHPPYSIVHAATGWDSWALEMGEKTPGQEGVEVAPADEAAEAVLEEASRFWSPRAKEARAYEGRWWLREPDHSLSRTIRGGQVVMSPLLRRHCACQDMHVEATVGMSVKVIRRVEKCRGATDVKNA